MNEKIIKKIFSFWWLAFVLAWSLAFFYTGINRINIGLNSIKDYFVKSFANDGVLYIYISFTLLVLFFILLIIKLRKGN